MTLPNLWLVIGCLLPGPVLAEEMVEPALDLTAAGLRVAGFLLVFLVLAGLVSRLARRLHPALGSTALDVLGGRNLAPGVGLRLVRVGSRCLLVGFTREQVTLLTELPLEEVQSPGQVSS